MALAGKDLDRATEALARLKSATGDTETTSLLESSLRVAQGDMADAEAILRNCIKRWPASVGPRLALAQIFIKTGRPAEGEAILKQLLEKNPADLRVLAPYVNSGVGRGDYASAIAALEAARKAAPQNNGLTAIEADALIRDGRPQEAAALLQGLFKLEDMPPILVNYLAKAQMAASQTDQARTTFDQAVKVSPTDVELRLAQARFLAAQNDVPGARAALVAINARVPGNYAAMMALLQLEVRTAGLDSGLVLASQLRAKPANMPQASLLKGDLLAQAHRYKDAAVVFEAERSSAPSLALTLRLADALMLAGGKDAEATAVLQVATEGIQSTDLGLLSRLAKLDIKAKRFAEAQEKLEAIVARQPNDPDALNNLAWLYYKKKDARALALGQRAYLASPTPDAADTLGCIKLQQGDVKSALLLLRDASRGKPDDLTISYHLATALINAGEKQEATVILEKIVAAGEAFEEAAAAASTLHAAKAR